MMHKYDQFPIYDCPNCGDTILVYVHEQIDSEDNEVYRYECCQTCNHTVIPKLDTDGKQFTRGDTNHEMAKALMLNIFDAIIDDVDDYGDPRDDPENDLRRAALNRGKP